MQIVKTTCEHINCDRVEEVPLVRPSQGGSDHIPPEWIVIDLQRERQGAHGGTGQKIFCSWRCVSQWALLGR